MIIQLNEDPEIVTLDAAWTGDWYAHSVQLVDGNGSAVDITTGTLGVTYTNVATGAAYSFGGGTAVLTKAFAAQGIVLILNPAAYPTVAVVRITVSFTNGSTVRRFGPLEVAVYAP